MPFWNQFSNSQYFGCRNVKNWFEIRHQLRISPGTALVDMGYKCTLPGLGNQAWGHIHSQAAGNWVNHITQNGFMEPSYVLTTCKVKGGSCAMPVGHQTCDRRLVLDGLDNCNWNWLWELARIFKDSLQVPLGKPLKVLCRTWMFLYQKVPNRTVFMKNPLHVVVFPLYANMHF